jgi:protein involved in polysaccharide export with SLBB domain
MRSAYVLALTLLASIGGCQTAPNEPPPEQAPLPEQAAKEEEWIAIGDTLIVSSPGRPELDLSERVSVQGVVFIPDLGPVRVAGLTAKEIREGLSERLRAFYGPLRLEVSIVLNRQTAIVVDGTESYWKDDAIIDLYPTTRINGCTVTRLPR